MKDYSNRIFESGATFPLLPSTILGTDSNGEVINTVVNHVSSLVFTQNTPSTHWHFAHNLGLIPFVIVQQQQTLGGPWVNIMDAIDVMVDAVNVDVYTVVPILGEIVLWGIANGTIVQDTINVDAGSY